MLKQRVIIFALLCLVNTGVHASTPAEEINSLIDSVGASGCAFVRNGKSHTAQDAADHLRMKYRRGKKYAKDAEQFISRLASKSSMSGRSYFMKCDGEEPQKAADWLLLKLSVMRGSTLR